MYQMIYQISGDVIIMIAFKCYDFLYTVVGDDYSDVFTNPLIFPMGDSMSLDGSLQCVDISLMEDMSIEGVHSFTVHIISVDPLINIISTQYATINIQDTNCKLIISICVYYNSIYSRNTIKGNA